jgi:hypothetical protein
MAVYSVRPGDAHRDRDAVVAVWTRNLQSHDEATHRRKFEWYYEQNPIGPGRFWVLEREPGGPVVGVAGLGLRRLCMGEQTLKAGLASDFAVDKEHRSLRPAMMLARTVAGSIEDGLDLIYGLPNSQSVGVFKRIGYDTGATLRRYVKVLRVERFLRSRVKQQLVRKGLAGVIDPALGAVSRETWRPRRGRLLREVQSFDRRFDELWGRATLGRQVAMERQSSFLEWRYRQCPLNAYTILALTAPGGDDLLGYAVCVQRDDQQVVVVDLFNGPCEGAREDLLAGVVRWARGRGAASVACSLHGLSDLGEMLRRYGFRLRGPEAPIAVLTRAGGPRLADLRDWHFLLADEDYN